MLLYPTTSVTVKILKSFIRRHVDMTLQFALPIAHRIAQPGLAFYDDFYSPVGQCLFDIDRYFNDECEGISLIWNTTFPLELIPPTISIPGLFGLYAMTYGSLSYQHANLVLRLRREWHKNNPDLRLFAR